MKNLLKMALFTATLGCGFVSAQVPIIYEIVNSGSLAPDPTRGSVMVSGSLATIVGQNLNPDTVAADGYPLPTLLAGTSVTVNGTLAPIVSVSPTQIQFQAPTISDLPPSWVAVSVKAPAGNSDPILASYVYDSIGLFTQDGSGCGQGQIFNIGAGGTATPTLNTPSNSAAPGEWIYLHATGAGPVAFYPIQDGTPAGPNPPALGSGGVARVGLEGLERFVPDGPQVIGIAEAIGLVGIDLITIPLPVNVAEGCAVPIKVLGISTLSQPVMISIHKGGGACEDAALGRVGAVYWKRTITDPQSPNPTISETFEARLVEAPSNLITLPPAPSPDPPKGPNCPGAAGRGLDAGTITIADQKGNSYPLNTSTELGTLRYYAHLRTGTLNANTTLSLSASGGADLDAFQSKLSLPAPIQITSILTPGTKVSSGNGPLTITWTGGTRGVTVTVTLSRINALGLEDAGAIASASGDSGSIKLTHSLNGPCFCLFGAGVQITVQVTPTDPPPAIVIPGIDEPVMQTWMYEYRFTGLVGQ